MNVLIRFLLLCLPMFAYAQSSLPPCPSNPGLHWHNCFGAYTYPDGNQYVGEWRDNNRNGLGTLTWADTSKYVGQYQKGDRHGLGTMTWANGNRYVGEFQGDKLNGRGTFTWADGEKYVGEFRNDSRHGQGIFYGADGTIKQSGEWADGNLSRSFAIDTSRFPFDGQGSARVTLPPCPNTGRKHNCTGSVTYSNGRYEGDFQNDERHGQGTYVWTGGEFGGQTYVGEWRNGRTNGQGTTTWSSGQFSGQRYVGEFRDGQRHGRGTFSFPNGNQYAGEFRNGDYNGQGTYTFSSGNRYVGEFRNGNFNGQGTFFWADGDRYVGEFRDDKRTGLGIFYGADASIKRSGEWADGNLIRPFAIDRSRFPFDGASQAQAVASSVNPGGHSGTNRIPEYPTTADPGRAERERLAAEAEAAQRRQQELERRLAAESRERERQAAEAEAARRRQQELEAQLAALQSQGPSRPASQAAATRNQRRVALVIGNADYKVSPLDNPVNDATDVDQTLRQLGFQTTLVRNATLGQMREATRRFAEQLPSADVALIYFAGHGIESNRKNYMIPVNAELKFEYELADQAYDAGNWLEMLESIRSTNAERVNIVILDACRNNNLIGSRSFGRGLGRMDAPTGTFLAYSTAPGKIAADGGRGQRNSPFTRHLLAVMQQPGLPIEEAFKEVRRNVSKETNGAQVPWESTSLTGFFTFRLAR